MGFSRKKLYPLYFQSNLPWPPWNFPFFCINAPGNPCFLLNLIPWNSNDFYSTPWTFTLPPGLLLYPLKFSIDNLDRGVTIFFWKSPICSLTSTSSSNISNGASINEHNEGSVRPKSLCTNSLMYLHYIKMLYVKEFWSLLKKVREHSSNSLKYFHMKFLWTLRRN